MSATLQRIASRMDAVNQRFERMQNLAEQPVPTGAYDRLQSELAGVRSEVQKMSDDFDQLSQSMQGAQPPADNLVGTLKRIGAAVIGSQIVKGVVGLSDGLTQTTARLNLMTDGLQSTADLQEMIYQSALRSRGVYTDTAAAVSKMGILAGDAFNSNEETIAFVEQLNKQFKIAGTSAEGQAAAMLQLTQAMGAGVLRGEELNSVFEQAPTIIQAITDYLGVTTGELREMAADGQITADIVKNAMFAAADETNAKFESIPMTWADVWTQATNIAIMALQPLLEGINWMANNLEIIAPLIIGIGSAIGILVLLANWANICAGATRLWAAAQTMLNTAWATSPLLVIIAGVILLVSLLFAVVAAINKVTGSSISAIGIITGALAVAGAFIMNLFGTLVNFAIDAFVALWNFIAAFANFFGNVFNDPVGAIARLFFDLVDTILSLLQSLASAIDTIFGSNLASAVQGWRDSLGGWVDSTFGQGEEIMAKVNAEDYHFERIEYSGAWDAGYNWGANLQDNIADTLGISTDVSDITIPTAADPTSLLSDIADNTDQIADDVEMSTEDLELLRDIAERQEINKYTTAEIRVEMVNNNTISSEMDIDGVVNLLEIKVQEAMAASAEGVHI